LAIAVGVSLASKIFTFSSMRNPSASMHRKVSPNSVDTGRDDLQTKVGVHRDVGEQPA
jgi:hypothetical protein